MVSTSGAFLAPWSVALVPSLYRAVQDPTVRSIIPLPGRYTLRHAVGFVLETVPELESRGGRACAIMENGRLQGSLSATPTGEQTARLGYWLTAPARGRGLIPQMVSQLAEMLRGDFESFELTISQDNLPSRKVAEKMGFAPVEFVSAHTFRSGETTPMVRYLRQV